MDSIPSFQLWAGRALCGIAITFLTMDAVGKLLQMAPQLNLDNSVQFTNGSGGVPVEFQIWNHAKTNYIVLKEHFFLKRQPSLPSSLFVGRVRTPSNSPSGDVGSRRPPVELVCRITGR